MISYQSKILHTSNTQQAKSLRKKIENLNAEIAHLRDLVAEKDLEIDELQKNNKAINQIIEMREFISESKRMLR